MSLQRGLVGHWALDTAYDTPERITDLSPSRNHGVLHGGVITDLPGRVEECVSLDGIDDKVVVPHAEELDVSTYDEFALSLWFRPREAINSSSLEQGLLSKRSSYGLWWDPVDNGALRFSTWSDQDILTTTRTEWEENTWYHVLATWRKDDYSRLYVDGVLDVDAAPIMNPYESDTPLEFGHRSYTGGYFYGDLDDVRLYRLVPEDHTIEMLLNARSRQNFSL